MQVLARSLKKWFAGRSSFWCPEGDELREEIEALIAARGLNLTLDPKDQLCNGTSCKFRIGAKP